MLRALVLMVLLLAMPAFARHHRGGHGHRRAHAAHHSGGGGGKHANARARANGKHHGGKHHAGKKGRKHR